jgi:hypothetical protein
MQGHRDVEHEIDLAVCGKSTLIDDLPPPQYRSDYWMAVVDDRQRAIDQARKDLHRRVVYRALDESVREFKQAVRFEESVRSAAASRRVLSRPLATETLTLKQFTSTERVAR